MNLLAIWIGFGVFVGGLVVLGVIARQKKVWLKVYLANPEMSEFHVYRTGWDKLWHGDEAGIMVFHTEDGKLLRVSKHWILKIEEE